MAFAIDGFLPFALLSDLSSQADTSAAQDPLGASVGWAWLKILGT